MEILPNGTMIDKITTYDEYLASDEMAKKRHVFEINEEDVYKRQQQMYPAIPDQLP